jgi:acyl-coenzyme A thioesterase PaaI-like protein
MALSIQKLLKLWEKTSRFPGGKSAFSRMVGLAVPYTGTIGANVLTLNPGDVSIALTDRRRVRNHLQSVHAMALANLGEFASGLALNSALTESQRSILVAFEIQYLKKARGTLTARSSFSPPANVMEYDAKVIAEILNTQNELVAKITAHWKVGLNSKKTS